MSSPVLRKNPEFQPQNGYYYNPNVTNNQNVMTVENTITKTVGLFVVLLVGAAVGWFIPALLIPAAIGALVLGLVNAFRRNPNVPLILAYSLVEGVFLGALSGIFEGRYPGIVSQAVIGTLVVFGVVLALFTSGKVRATPKLTKVFMVALISYALFSLVNFVISLTGVMDNAFGIRGYEVFGIPLGLIIGAFAVLLASYSLVLDFTYIQQGAENRAPIQDGWTAAFGLMVTLVWLYTEILRIIAIFRE